MADGLEAILRFLDPAWVVPPIAIVWLAWLVGSRWKAAERIKTLATELRITFSTGADSLLGPSPVATLLGLFSSWRLDGKMGGVPVSVYQSTERRSASDETTQQYMVLKATLDPPLGLGLHMTRRQAAQVPSLVQKIAQSLLPESDNRTEASSIEEVLDQKVVIRTTSPEDARKLFGDAAVRDQILLAMELEGSVTIGDQGVRVETGWSFKHPEKIRDILGVISATAARLQPRSSA